MGETRTLDIESLPEDPAVVRQMLIDAIQQLQERDRMIEKLNHYLELLKRAHFGRSSEKVDPSQLTLTFVNLVFPAEPPTPSQPAAAPSEPKKGHGRRRLPAELVRTRVVHDLPEKEKVCDDCGGALSCIGAEVAERAEYHPATLHVNQDVRPKYACKKCQGKVKIAPPPTQPIQKGLPGPGLLAYVVTSKYADHLPLNRQVGILRRHGLRISRSTLCDWVGWAADLLEPIWRAIKKDVLASKVVHTDDTPVPVLDVTRPGKTREGHLWVHVGDRNHLQTIFNFTPNREGKHAREFLAAYKGYLQADAYAGYNELYASGDVIEVGCWAHTRRKYFEAQTTDRERALAALAWIGQLYQVEKAAKDLPPGPRRVMRQERSRPILDGFRQWLDRQQPSVLPKSPMGEAFTYVRNQWAALNRYLDDGNLNIDNNSAERGLRGCCIGRRNWLFAGSDEGGKRAAILYSLVGSCKQNGVDPWAYLRDVIERVSTHPARRVDELMPRLWRPPPDSS